MNHVKVLFDVDGTLITYEDQPRYDVIDIFKKFENLGCFMMIASGGGKDYAERWAQRLGLKALILDKFDLRDHPKPDIAFDDEDVKFGKVNIRV